MQCFRCKAENGERSKFCQDCGAPLGITCLKCGAISEQGKKFCGECGTPVDAAFQQSMAGAKHYTPKHLAERILTSRSALEGERKLVTVLFCDIAQSTELAARVGADEMHTLLDRFFQLALEEVHRVEGTVNQFLGDGFMALFGAPLAHEDHARRALLAALAIRQRIREASEPQLSGLRLRMGVNTGIVVVGKIGDNLRMDYTAVGDTTHLAARLQQSAQVDTIRASSATQRAAAAWFEFQSLGQQPLKGIGEPIELFELLVARTGPNEAGTSAGTGISSPLVGRETELAVLTASLSALRQGRGGILFLTGEPGVGKSRLLAETRRSPEASGVRWLEGRSLSFGRNLSYWPFIEILKQVFAIQDSDTETQAWNKLERGCKALFDIRVDEIAPYVGIVLGLEMTEKHEQRVKYLDPQALGLQVFLSMRQLFELLAQRQPVLLLMEDWHWVDQSSVLLCEHLLPLASSIGLLFWFVARADPGESTGRIRAAAGADPSLPVQSIALTTLAEEQSQLLLDNLVGSHSLPPAFRSQLLRKTDGNPFFLEELIRALIADGVLAEGTANSGWRLAKPVEGLALPDTIQGVIVARIDRLEEGVKAVLKLASVIGRSFFLRVLQAVSEAGQALDSSLGQLQQAELIRLREQLPELEYTFKHALVQEAAYDSIVAERRRSIHRRVAEAVEAVFADRRDEFTSLLAYHYARAEVWDKALSCLIKAGDQAGRMAADGEALEHYRRAEVAYMKAASAELTPLERASLDRKLGQAFFGVGNYDQAVEHFLRAMSHVGLQYPTTRWGIRRRALTFLGSHLIRRMTQRYRRAVMPSMDLAIAKEISIIGQRMAWLNYMTDQERMVLDTLIQVDVGEKSRDAMALSLGYTTMAIVLTVSGAHRWARRYLTDAVAIAKTTADPAIVGLSLFGTGWLEADVGAWNDSVRTLERSAAEYRSAGDLRGWAMATVFTCRFLSEEVGRDAIAERTSELVRVGQQARDPQITCSGLIQLGNLTLACGTLEQAARHLVAARTLAAESSANALDVMAAGILGKCYLLTGNLNNASEVLLDATRTIRSKSIRGFPTAEPLNGTAALYLMLADRLSGAARRKALADARRACRVALSCAKKATAWMPEALRLYGLLAWLAGDPKSAQLRWQRSIAAAESLGFAVQKALTLLEMGDRLADADMVDAARLTFANTGTKVYLALSVHAQAKIASQTSGNSASAVRLYDQAITALEEVKAGYELGVAYRHRAHLYQHLKQPDRVRSDLVSARRCFGAVGAALELAEVERETGAISLH